MNGALDHSDQPDPDAIKMFVGQIPRSWSEKELKELFEPYGAVYQINVLRDRSQNPPQSKGTVSGVCAVGGDWGLWAFLGVVGITGGRTASGSHLLPLCPVASPAPPRAPAPLLPPGQVDPAGLGRRKGGAEGGGAAGLCPGA